MTFSELARLNGIDNLTCSRGLALPNADLLRPNHHNPLVPTDSDCSERQINDKATMAFESSGVAAIGSDNSWVVHARPDLKIAAG